MPMRIDRLLIRVEHTPSRELPRELTRAQDPLTAAHCRERVVVDHAVDGARHLLRVRRVDQQPCVTEDFLQRATMAGYNRHYERHLFEHHDAKSFIKRRLYYLQSSL